MKKIGVSSKFLAVTEVKSLNQFLISRNIDQNKNKYFFP